MVSDASAMAPKSACSHIEGLDREIPALETELFKKPGDQLRLL